MVLALVLMWNPGSLRGGGIELGCEVLSHALHPGTLRSKRALSPYHLLSECSNHWAVLLNARRSSSCCLASMLADGEVG